MVNNSDRYVSEGYYIINLDLVCVYHPISADEQNPNSTDSTIDSTQVRAFAWGPTAASVDSDIIVDIGKCGG
ncbi:hypothetical protein [Streptomyces sp. BP-8]|uniref:Uncharacterized protein n=1 Tax=Streptomyces sirii TaxID=3127701 RepID=A0ABZ2R583_9ACTN